MTNAVTARKKIKAKTITVTAALSPENTAAVCDYEFWTGAPIDAKLINKAIACFMEIEGESVMWDAARDPQRRAAAFKRANMSEARITRFNASLDSQFEKLCRETNKLNHRVLKARAKSMMNADEVFAKTVGIRL